MPMIVELGRLMAAAQGAALVLCVDQLEDIFNQAESAERFRLIVDVLVAFAETLPSGIVILSCLSDYYESHRQSLPRPRLDRIEHDPEPIHLTASRSADEVTDMVARRLGYLYEEAGLVAEPGSTYPFRHEHLAPLANLNTRKVLDHCRLQPPALRGDRRVGGARRAGGRGSGGIARSADAIGVQLRPGVERRDQPQCGPRPKQKRPRRRCWRDRPSGATPSCQSPTGSRQRWPTTSFRWRSAGRRSGASWSPSARRRRRAGPSASRCRSPSRRRRGDRSSWCGRRPTNMARARRWPSRSAG